jgi:hypothetical protein
MLSTMLELASLKRVKNSTFDGSVRSRWEILAGLRSRSRGFAKGVSARAKKRRRVTALLATFSISRTSGLAARRGSCRIIAKPKPERAEGESRNVCGVVDG